MNSGETKDYIEEYVEKRTHASNQAHEGVIRDLQVTMDSVRKSQEETGRSQEEMYRVLREHIEKVTPMMEEFAAYALGKKLAGAAFRGTVWIGGSVLTLTAAYYAVKQLLISIMK